MDVLERQSLFDRGTLPSLIPTNDSIFYDDVAAFQVCQYFSGDYAPGVLFTEVEVSTFPHVSLGKHVTQIYLGIERVRGRMVFLVAVSALAAVVMMGVTVGLVPRLGIVGAGYGVLAGYGTGALLSLWMLGHMTPLVRQPVNQSLPQ